MNCFSFKERLCFTDQTTSTTTTIRAMSTMTTTTLNQYYHHDKHQYDQHQQTNPKTNTNHYVINYNKVIGGRYILN